MTKILNTKSAVSRTSSRGDGPFRAVIIALSFVIVGAFVLAVLQLGGQSLPAIREFGLSFLTRIGWDPVNLQFGALSFIVGTLLTAFGALVLAVPLAVAAAIFVTEYAPKWLAEPVSYLVELLAAIPSVIYGLWGVFVLVPILQKVQIALFIDNASPGGLLPNPALNWLVPTAPTGFGILTAVLILTVMVIPYTASVARDVIRLVPRDQREAMYALGATKWEVVRMAVLPYARAGIFGGVILSLGRALGETLAVTMVIGNTTNLPRNIWDSTATMSSIIANEFAEASRGLHLSSLLTIGLLLFFTSVIVNYVARVIIARLTPKGIQ